MGHADPGDDEHAEDFVRARFTTLVALPAAAFIVAAVWVLWDATSTPKSAAFTSTPQFLLWWLLLCGQAAIWTIALSFSWSTVSRRIRELRNDRALAPRTVAGLALSLGLLAVLPIGQSSVYRGKFFGLITISFEHLPKIGEHPLAHYGLKIDVIFGVGLLIAFLAIAGTLLTAVAFNRFQPAQPPGSLDLERFLALRDDLAALLGVAGSLIGLAMMSIGGLRVAELAANHEPYFTTHLSQRLEFAPGYVLGYGLFYSGMLAFAFAPSLLAMRAAGARLREASHPLPAPSNPNFNEIIARRDGIDNVLQTSLSANTTIKVAIAILTPLAGSLASLVLPTT